MTNGECRTVGQGPLWPMTNQARMAGISKLKSLMFIGLVLCLGAAQAVQVRVPDSMSGIVGDTVLVPILVSGQVGDSVIAVDITLSFGETVLTATSGYIVGKAAPGWVAYANPFPCSLLIAMVGASPLGAGDTLIVAKMLADAADTTTVWFSRCWLNEGNVPCTTLAGKFYGYTVGLEEGGLLTATERMLSMRPSPVQGRAEIRCRLDRAARARLEIRDPRGNLVRTLHDGTTQPGESRVEWDCKDNQGRRVPAGVYFCTLSAENQRFSRKVVLAE